MQLITSGIVSALVVVCVSLQAIVEVKVTELLRARAAAVSRDLDVVPGDYREGITGALSRLEQALAADRQYLGVFELERPFEMHAAFSFAAKQQSVKSAEAFSKEWSKVGAPTGPSSPPLPLPLVVRALATSAEGRAPATYKASLPYAEDAGLAAGLFYLGESVAFGQFADFCRKLPWRADAPAPGLRSTARELDALDAEVVKAYETADAAGRPAFINVNVTIKLARQLDEAGHYAASLLQYLLARYRFAMISIPPSSAEGVRARLDRHRATLSAVRQDHSIGELFLQLADANVATENPGPRSAAAVADAVLPAYFRAVKTVNP